jgi:hypothetical protein
MRRAGRIGPDASHRWACATDAPVWSDQIGCAWTRCFGRWRCPKVQLPPPLPTPLAATGPAAEPAGARRRLKGERKERMEGSSSSLVVPGGGDQHGGGWVEAGERRRRGVGLVQGDDGVCVGSIAHDE